MALSPDELDRYARHLVLREVGGPGQNLLGRSRVLIVGAGGLGAPAALYLAGAGVGSLGLIDFDGVSLSDLQRQILYRTDDVGRPKIDAAADALAALNPHVALDVRLARLTEANARAHIADFDVILDGSDDFPTRFAVNAACHALGRPLVSGAVGRWSGQVSVFASGAPDTSGRWVSDTRQRPCYQCLVPAAPPDADLCARDGVVGALTGLVGSLMALEAIKLITGAGAPLIGRLWLHDGLTGESRTVGLPADPACPICGSA